MTRALVDSRRVALDLHALLRDIDPARWTDELEGGVRERLDAIRDELVELLETSWTEVRADAARRGLLPPRSRPDADPRAVQVRLEELHRLIREHAPSTDAPPSARREAWMALRAKLQPAYESFAATLRAWSIHVPSLRPTNYARNAFHVLCAVVVVALVEHVLTTPARLVGAALAGATAAWTMELSRRLSPAVNRLLMALFGPVAHPHEAHRVNSATWYASALVVLALGFEPVVGVVAIAVLGFGDPTAAIVGRRWGRTKLIHGRSLEGTLAFVLAGGLAALVALRTWHAGLPWNVTIAAAFGAAVTGAIAELVARRVDDNLAIPLAAALGASSMIGMVS